MSASNEFAAGPDFACPRLIGMVHAGALPGTPRSRRAVRDLAAAAAREATDLATAGFDGIIIENMHDVPYLRRTVGPEITAAMTCIVGAVRSAVDVSLGVQILAGANDAAMAVAHAAGAQFIRAEGFTFAAVADEGLLEEADAGPLLRYRRAIGADPIGILADVRKKHSAHAITADIDMAEAIHAAVFAGADGMIVTGPSTARPADPGELADAIAAAADHAGEAGASAAPGDRPAAAPPILVGSGVTAASAPGLLAAGTHGLIVGSSIKAGGDWRRPVDPERAAAFVAACR
ncbi:MAG: BtpA/SgcQ family protein [Phycisphaerales bacterium]